MLPIQIKQVTKPNQALQQRRAGVLLHISSLPNSAVAANVSPLSTSNCINITGVLGANAHLFVDFLAEIGASIWQTLPLNMPHHDGSPYQCLSAHAGNPAFICLENLVALNLLDKSDIDAKDLSTPQAKRQKLFDKAYIQFKQQKNAVMQHDFTIFCRENNTWLNDFALFLALKNKFQHRSWDTWPNAYKNREDAVMVDVKYRYEFDIAVTKFTQFLFFNQWYALKLYANQHGVAMFGDIPIFVAYDSADVWAKPQLFKLDAEKHMQVVAGVPPDYFSETGQRWGNPHYNWQAMKADGFKWWLARMKTQYNMFDLLRIDHFRGLESAWEIPADEETAMNGQWVKAPGAALLRAIIKRYPSIELIAEDLGIITDDVNALREKFNLPSMKILQFAFGGEENNPYLPHNIHEQSVAYTGTHDNDTTLGWYEQLDDHAKNHLHTVLQSSLAANTENAPIDMPNALVELVMNTNADIAIVPMQDILGLNSSHRMNTPGTSEGNWQWRFSWDQLHKPHIEAIAKVIQQSKRASNLHA